MAVLWTLILLSTIAATFSTETRSDTRVARNIVDSAAARAAADAGVQRGILDLFDSRGGALIGTAKFEPNGTVRVWHFNDSTVYISVRDELGKLNLNQAAEVHLAALFQAAGLDENAAAALADAVADFRDPDDIRRLQGAEEKEYRAANLGWGPKNAAFQTVEELQRVLGMNSELYERVARYLTIYTIGNTINPDRADEGLTTALRRVGYSFFTATPGTAFSIRAEARHVSGAVFVREAVAQVVLDSRQPVRMLAWRQAWSPAENPVP